MRVVQLMKATLKTHDQDTLVLGRGLRLQGESINMAFF